MQTKTCKEKMMNEERCWRPLFSKYVSVPAEPPLVQLLPADPKYRIVAHKKCGLCLHSGFAFGIVAACMPCL